MARLASIALAVVLGCSSREVSAFTNDPLCVRQAWLVDVRAPEAWAFERGNRAVVIAVVDNGAAIDHPDLAGTLWTNDGEVDGDGLDNDGNGFIDDRHGWNVLTDSGDVRLPPRTTESATSYGHATAAAGIVAAHTDNQIGVAGSCPGCRWMPIVARDFRSTNTVVSRLEAALAYAVRNGARVVSVSDGVLPLGLSAEEAARLTDAVTRATEAGVLVVASAGNDGQATVRWPARIPTVLAVAALDEDGTPAAFTSYGPEVDVSAPGVAVFTTTPSGYGDFAGTSASAPIVAGLAGLLFSLHPTWTPAQVTARIRETAQAIDTSDRPALRGQLGAGRVDFARALRD